jgi:hypothetical protein
MYSLKTSSVLGADVISARLAAAGSCMLASICIGKIEGKMRRPAVAKQAVKGQQQLLFPLTERGMCQRPPAMVVTFGSSCPLAEVVTSHPRLN